MLFCAPTPSLGGVAERSEFKNNIIAGGDVTFSKGDRREAVVDEGLDFACEIRKAKLSFTATFFRLRRVTSFGSHTLIRLGFAEPPSPKGRFWGAEREKSGKLFSEACCFSLDKFRIFDKKRKPDGLQRVFVWSAAIKKR